MKRLTIIFNAALLSLLIIIVSGGITLMHCNHTGNVSVVQLSAAALMSRQSADGAQEEGCQMGGADCHCSHCSGEAISELPCMDYTTLSCQPSIFAHGFCFSQMPACVQLPCFMESVAAPLLPALKRRMLTECSGRHGPPRHYLRLITVLQI